MVTNHMIEYKTLMALLTIFLFSLLSCNKEGENHWCYDETLVHSNGCAADCPGFEGCDGKTYCNSCEAAKNGIGPK